MRKKEYLLNLRKLIKYAKENDIIVKIVKTRKEAGSFSVFNNTIRIHNNMSNDLTISVLLHELGHFLDSKNLIKKHDIINSALNKLFANETLSKKEMDTILKHEKTAWSNGKKLGKDLHIPLNGWFFKCEQASLNSYLNSIKIDQ